MPGKIIQIKRDCFTFLRKQVFDTELQSIRIEFSFTVRIARTISLILLNRDIKYL